MDIAKIDPDRRRRSASRRRQVDRDCCDGLLTKGREVELDHGGAGEVDRERKSVPQRIHDPFSPSSPNKPTPHRIAGAVDQSIVQNGR